MLRENQLRILHPAKLFFKRERNTFSEREFVASRLALYVKRSSREGKKYRSKVTST